MDAVIWKFRLLLSVRLIVLLTVDLL